MSWSVSLTRFLLAVLVCGLFASGARAQEWQEIKGDHFLVYFEPLPAKADTSGDSATGEVFGKEVLRKAELYYQRIAADLGYARISGFWTWDNRVKIYLYRDHKAYVASSDHPSWSVGMADYDTKTIHSYQGSIQFVDSVLPHEIAHLIFRDFVGFKSDIPLWLDEGVAQWAEEAQRQHVRGLAKELLLKNSLLSFDDMMKLDIHSIKHKDNVYIRKIRTLSGESGVLLLTGENLIKTYYIQAVSLVSFLIDRFGSADFANLCRLLRDGKKLSDALISVYGIYIKDLDEFELEWKKYVQQQS